MNKERFNFAERVTFYALFAIGVMLIIIMATSCSRCKHGFDYKSHKKSNAEWKHKAENNKLPKCNRH